MNRVAEQTTHRPPRSVRSRLLFILSFVVFVGMVVGLGWVYWNLPEPRVRVSGTAEQREAVMTAVADFDRAGLDLPPVAVYYSDERSDCGRYGHGVSVERWPRNEVWLCTDSERVLYHELAHVWTYGYLDHSTRLDFTYYRDVRDWNGAHLEWPEKASEHAAELVAWYVTAGRFEPRLGVMAPPELEPAWAWLLARAGVRLMD